MRNKNLICPSCCGVGWWLAKCGKVALVCRCCHRGGMQGPGPGHQMLDTCLSLLPSIPAIISYNQWDPNKKLLVWTTMNLLLLLRYPADLLLSQKLFLGHLGHIYIHSNLLEINYCPPVSLFLFLFISCTLENVLKWRIALLLGKEIFQVVSVKSLGRCLFLT